MSPLHNSSLHSQSATARPQLLHTLIFLTSQFLCRSTPPRSSSACNLISLCNLSHTLRAVIADSVTYRTRLGSFWSDTTAGLVLDAGVLHSGLWPQLPGGSQIRNSLPGQISAWGLDDSAYSSHAPPVPSTALNYISQKTSVPWKLAVLR